MKKGERNENPETPPGYVEYKELITIEDPTVPEDPAIPLGDMPEDKEILLILDESVPLGGMPQTGRRQHVDVSASGNQHHARQLVRDTLWQEESI